VVPVFAEVQEVQQKVRSLEELLRKLMMMATVTKLPRWEQLSEECEACHRDVVLLEHRHKHHLHLLLPQETLHFTQAATTTAW
jgi:hypothetical protein